MIKSKRLLVFTRRLIFKYLIAHIFLEMPTQPMPSCVTPGSCNAFTPDLIGQIQNFHQLGGCSQEPGGGFCVDPGSIPVVSPTGTVYPSMICPGAQTSVSSTSSSVPNAQCSAPTPSYASPSSWSSFEQCSTPSSYWMGPVSLIKKTICLV